MGTRAGDAAFPVSGTGYYSNGMTIRDYLAGQVVSEVLRAYLADNKAGLGSARVPENVSAWAYKLADAMLAEREKSS